MAIMKVGPDSVVVHTPQEKTPSDSIQMVDLCVAGSGSSGCTGGTLESNTPPSPTGSAMDIISSSEVVTESGSWSPTTPPAVPPFDDGFMAVALMGGGPLRLDVQRRMEKHVPVILGTHVVSKHILFDHHRVSRNPTTPLTNSQPPKLALPPELHYQILSYIPALHLLTRIAPTCKSWRAAIEFAPAALWMRICTDVWDWGEEEENCGFEEEEGSVDARERWKKVHRVQKGWWEGRAGVKRVEGGGEG
ncbi:hypothetical protein HDV00_009997 [Rhizophlyctis rosea]|nr:hypothetical protein HDV00_009997 [Rhizophlyctis rosea]